MLAAVGLYALVLGALFATVDALVDRAATLGRRPRRWIWVAALTASLGLTAAAPWRSTDAPDTGAASLGVTLAVGATESTNAVAAPRASMPSPPRLPSSIRCWRASGSPAARCSPPSCSSAP